MREILRARNYRSCVRHLPHCFPPVGWCVVLYLQQKFAKNRQTQLLGGWVWWGGVCVEEATEIQTEQNEREKEKRDQVQSRKTVRDIETKHAHAQNKKENQTTQTKRCRLVTLSSHTHARTRTDIGWFRFVSLLCRFQISQPVRVVKKKKRKETDETGTEIRNNTTNRNASRQRTAPPPHPAPPTLIRQFYWPPVVSFPVHFREVGERDSERERERER